MVQCAGCGFLCVRQKDTRELTEVDAQARTKWHVPQRAVEKDPHAYRALLFEGPYCFVMAIDMRAEIAADAVAANEGNHVLNFAAVDRVIHRDRECAKRTPWQQGFTPKEHKEMMLSDETLRIQKAMAEDALRWQQESKEADRVWQEKIAEKNRWEARKNIYVAAGLTLVVSAVVSAGVSIFLKFVFG